MEQLYLKQLTPQERKAHDIAKSHLGTSFDILRSNGYKVWMNKQDKESLSSSLSSGGPSSGGPLSCGPSSGSPSLSLSASDGPSTVQK
jgi:hypothetical protein